MSKNTSIDGSLEALRDLIKELDIEQKDDFLKLCTEIKDFVEDLEDKFAEDLEDRINEFENEGKSKDSTIDGLNDDLETLRNQIEKYEKLPEYHDLSDIINGKEIGGSEYGNGFCVMATNLRDAEILKDLCLGLKKR